LLAATKMKTSISKSETRRRSFKQPLRLGMSHPLQTPFWCAVRKTRHPTVMMPCRYLRRRNRSSVPRHCSAVVSRKFEHPRRRYSTRPRRNGTASTTKMQPTTPTSRITYSSVRFYTLILVGVTGPYIAWPLHVLSTLWNRDPIHIERIGARR